MAMVNFVKNKDDQTERKHGYELLADEEFADILLTEQDAPPLKAALLEPDTNKEDDFVYELVLEDKVATTDEQPTDASLNEQVAKLCHEYEAINQQLEKSLIASNDLTNQLEKSKKVVTIGYVALFVGVLAFLVGLGAAVVGINMQRDIDDLRASVASLTSQLALAKKETTLHTKELDGRTALLSDKLDKILAVDNLDDVLQVTGELRKQVDALASKNLGIINTRNQAANASVNPNKISSPSPKPDSAAPSQTDKSLAANHPVDKAEPATKVDAAKKVHDDKLDSVRETTNNNAGANWAVTLGAFKDKTLARHAVNRFKNAGISAVIVQTKVKKHVWYRVVSKGFKDKQEAQKHAEQVKALHITPSAVLTKTR